MRRFQYVSNLHDQSSFYNTRYWFCCLTVARHGDNLIDISPSYSGISPGHYRVADLSYPFNIAGFSLISAKNVKPGARFLEGVFDNMSYGFIALSLLCLGFTLWLLERTESRRASLLECLLLTFGLLTNERLDSNNPRLFLYTYQILFGIHICDAVPSVSDV